MACRQTIRWPAERAHRGVIDGAFVAAADERTFADAHHATAA